MTNESRVVKKSWNDLTEKEWEKEFEHSRKEIEAIVIKVLLRPDFAQAFEIEYDREHRIDIIWKSGLYNDDLHMARYPLNIYFKKQRRDKYASYNAFTGIELAVEPSYILRWSGGMRKVRYVLRKNGSYNLAKIEERIINILERSLNAYEWAIVSKAETEVFEKRLAKAHPEFVWEDGTTTIGEGYSAPSLEIEADRDFETDGFDIELKLRGLTMAEVMPLIALAEKYVKKDDAE